ncbi:MAG: DUF547 domain-containing protein [Gammaproteobacteria bacterium]|nr:DUF547 domain-containing protein [Gammaproteobacteria bacterium]
MASAAQRITIEADIPDVYAGGGFAHDDFEELLATYIRANGHVDYDSWHANAGDLGKLDGYLAAVSAFSPENANERFSSRNDELAYWMYAYNAYVIKAILVRWPLDSVTDVKATFEIVRGLGFFYSQRFRFGEKWYSLYTVENKKIRARYKDARIHFVLNCGSESCPVLRPELPVGDELEPFLQKAAVEFVSEERNVRIDHDNKRVVMSEIFKMYRKDFINDLRHRGLPARSGLLDYVASIAPDELRDQLLQVTAYKVDFEDYDWSINNAIAGE